MHFTSFAVQVLKVAPEFHAHRFFEGHLVISGDARCEWRGGTSPKGMRSENSFQPLKKGDFVTLWPGETHRFVPGLGPEPFLQIYFGFLPGVSETRFLRDLEGSELRGRVFRPGSGLFSLFQRVKVLTEKKTPMGQRWAACEIMAFYYSIMAEGSCSSRGKIAHPLAAELYGALLMAVQKRFSIKDFAGQKGVDPSRLNRLFRHAFGEGPLRTFQKLKLDGALRYLREHGCTLAEASEAFGYANPFHLSKQCRSIRGLSPRALLRR